MSAETWLPIPGFPDYKVSDQGRILSNRGPAPRILRGSPNVHTGHRLVALVGADGAQSLMYVHRVVLLAFVGPLPLGMLSRHLDGDTSNNRLENLAYGTPAENHADRRSHIVSELRAGEITTQEAADSVGVSRNWIIQLCRRGRIKGRKVRGSWVVDAADLASVFASVQVGRPRKQRAA